MKIEIRWMSGNIQTLHGVPEDSELVENIRSGEIFHKIYGFEYNKQFCSLNFIHAEQIGLEDE